MSRIPSHKTKISRGMGTGRGGEYKPYITTSEFNSLGTTSVIPDWKNGRGIHCLSQAEAFWYYVLRWDDSNVDIREQFPLERELTLLLCDEYGFKHPGYNSDYIMTTDFLITKDNGSLEAYSIKVNRELSERALQILCIEKLYWMNMGIQFRILFKEDLNITLVNNIRNVVKFYDDSSVFDDLSHIKHLIAVKSIPWDMENVPISNRSLKNGGYI